METTLSWITRHRRGAVLGAALALTLAAGVTSRALATRGVEALGGAGSALFAAQGPVRLSGELEGTKLLRGGDGLARLELSISGHSDEPAATARRLPTEVVVVLDRSGSMEGEKLLRAKAATRALLRELGPGDLFELVAYANEAVVVVPPTAVTRENLASLDARIDAVAVDGGTNIAAGLDLGMQGVRARSSDGGAARLILISDGMANVGDTSLSGLTGRARETARSGVVSAIGVGSDFDERVMAAIADAGTGNFYYLDEQRDLARIFAHELGAARTTVASALQVEIRPAPGVRVVEAAGYPLERDGDIVRFSPGALFDGQDRRIWVTLAVSESGADAQSLGRFGVRYEHAGRQESLELPESLRVSWADRTDDVVRALSPAAWERSVQQEAYGKLEEKVAGYVRAGEPQRAYDEISSFKSRVDPVNGVMQSPAVAKKLDQLKDLEADVHEAFSGENQPEKQNRLAKSKAESSVDARRMGAKVEGAK
jgi:Ca-activated chloride channel family protein